MGILASFFVPSMMLVKYSKEKLYFVPINKGVTGYYREGEGIKIEGIDNEMFKKLVLEIYEKYFRNSGIEINMFFEIPSAWEFNTLSCAIIALCLSKKFKTEVRISELITEAMIISKELELEEILLKVYYNKKAVKINIKENNIENFQFDRKKYIISKVRSDKFILKDIRDILNRFFKENKNKYYFENCITIICKYNKLVEKVESILDDPEKIVISRYYEGGIRLYSL